MGPVHQAAQTRGGTPFRQRLNGRPDVEHRGHLYLADGHHRALSPPTGAAKPTSAPE